MDDETRLILAMFARHLHVLQETQLLIARGMVQNREATTTAMEAMARVTASLAQIADPEKRSEAFDEVMRLVRDAGCDAALRRQVAQLESQTDSVSAWLLGLAERLEAEAGSSG